MRFTPSPSLLSHAEVNISAIPLLLSDGDWRFANDCGWTKENVTESAILLTDSCGVRTLLDDGWEIVGMRYTENFIGGHCRYSMNTQQDASRTCDPCADAGATLLLRYKGLMEMEFMVNMKERTVKPSMTNRPEGAASISGTDSTSIVFQNGTVFYTFRRC